ncbi:anion permease [Archangium violaceum]|uniref:SLC13 family permease n=1 Tax=Archangium violaceum TaxID=83451 RepID=UPI00193B495A|nr:SLC13 family permease [Archangium violaceum]QRK08836.1 anion permease [Archangium violaceum]
MRSLAKAASRTGLERALANRVLRWSGGNPPWTMLGAMGLTFAFSMFMSNTATTAMMLAAVGPLVAGLRQDEPFGKALLLGIPVAANLGGMGTVIGSPPNAIAAAALEPSRPIGFSVWMMVALPPALVLAGAAWLYLRHRYPVGVARIVSLTGRRGRKRTYAACWLPAVCYWPAPCWGAVRHARTS